MIALAAKAAGSSPLHGPAWWDTQIADRPNGIPIDRLLGTDGITERKLAAVFLFFAALSIYRTPGNRRVNRRAG